MRKLKEWPKDKKIIAVDFDGTITKKDNRFWTGRNSYVNDVMEPNLEIIESLKLNRNNIYLILWSCRKGKALRDAIKFCTEHDLYFDAVNKNIVRYPSSRKIMADIYIDDKSCYLNWVQKL